MLCPILLSLKKDSPKCKDQLDYLLKSGKSIHVEEKLKTL